MLSPKEARPTSTPKSVSKATAAFVPKALAKSRCTPTAKTTPKLYNKPSECC